VDWKESVTFDRSFNIVTDWARRRPDKVHTVISKSSAGTVDGVFGASLVFSDENLTDMSFVLVHLLAVDLSHDSWFAVGVNGFDENRVRELVPDHHTHDWLTGSS